MRNVAHTAAAAFLMAVLGLVWCDGRDKATIVNNFISSTVAHRPPSEPITKMANSDHFERLLKFAFAVFHWKCFYQLVVLFYLLLTHTKHAICWGFFCICLICSFWFSFAVWLQIVSSFVEFEVRFGKSCAFRRRFSFIFFDIFCRTKTFKKPWTYCSSNGM